MTGQNPTRLRWPLLGLVLVLVVTLTSVTMPGCRQGPDKLVFGLVAPSSPDQPGGIAREPAENLAETLGALLRVSVDIYPFESFAEMSAAVAAGQVDILMTNSFAYVYLHDTYGASVLFKTPAPAGDMDLAGEFITLESGPSSLDELKGAELALVDPASPSGYLFPTAYLILNGILEAADLPSTAFLGTPNAVIEAVLAGEVDAGVCPSGTLALFQGPGLVGEDGAALRVIAESPHVPASAVAVRAGLDADLVERIKDAVSATVADRAGNAAWLMVTGTDRVLEAQELDYGFIRDACGALDIDVEVLAGE